ncbi:MAG TPA: hypothetical protein VJN70_04285 [Gemmatimonadaceae bacterium]|nr:hypothetical protein [Gemmatimonadaceae bacterium]
MSIDSVWHIGPGQLAARISLPDDFNLSAGDTVSLTVKRKGAKK